MVFIGQPVSIAPVLFDGLFVIDLPIVGLGSVRFRRPICVS